MKNKINIYCNSVNITEYTVNTQCAIKLFVILVNQNQYKLALIGLILFYMIFYLFLITFDN